MPTEVVRLQRLPRVGGEHHGEDAKTKMPSYLGELFDV